MSTLAIPSCSLILPTFAELQLLSALAVLRLIGFYGRAAGMGLR